MYTSLVPAYYASFDRKEWDRLTWPEGSVEFAVTKHFLKKHLPENGRVLDIGGATGRYSIWLAEMGYTTVLADLSPNLLDIAREKIGEAGVGDRIESISVCDVCDLSRYRDNSFDAVVCLGPFYHLTQETDRAKAASELLRVLKPGAPAFIAFISIYSFLRRTIALGDERHHLSQAQFLDQLLQRGIFLNEVPGRFNSGFGVDPQKLRPMVEAYGFKSAELLSDAGFAFGIFDQIKEIEATDSELYKKVMEMIIGSAGDPSLLGAAGHLLYVGRK